MKRMILLLLLLSVVGAAFCQAVDSTVHAGKDSTKISNKLLEEILTNLKEIKDQNSDKTYIGTFKIKEDVVVFLNGGNSTFSAALERRKVVGSQNSKDSVNIFKIDSAQIYISEGVIEHIKVYTNNKKIYYNKYAPIQLLTIEKRFDDKLYDSSTGDYIYLKDAVDFDAYRRFNYFPDEQSILLSNVPDATGKKENAKKLNADNNINALVTLQVYSDFLALFGDQPNGLVQLEASSKFYLHRGNWANSFAYKPLDAIEPFFHFNRIDSKFDTIRLSDIGQVNRLELFRRSTYSVGLSTNLLRWDWRPSNSLELKVGYMLNSGNLVVDSLKTSYTLHSPFTDLALKSKKLNNFGIDLRVRYMLQKLNPNELIKNDKWEQLLSYRASLFYFPNKKQDNKFFLRFINYLNLSNRDQDFSQLQFGYQTSLKF
ncbi:hypothetical protein ACR777_15515 [Sphingobacterium spiritivorum]|uniref:hypothetical protein n=1 Tax=Sphingobacterium spiritivorum TaxID=258 RepID=UPI003DA525F6